MAATLMRDTAFKRVLKVMPVGTAVQKARPAPPWPRRFLHEPEAGGCAIPLRITDGGEGESNYTLIASMTEAGRSRGPWHGETGAIDKEMLARYLRDTTSPIYYIAGPPGIVKGLHMMINESGVDQRDIRTEVFSGY